VFFCVPRPPRYPGLELTENWPRFSNKRLPNGIGGCLELLS
jgi:hypothetical protein